MFDPRNRFQILVYVLLLCSLSLPGGSEACAQSMGRPEYRVITSYLIRQALETREAVGDSFIEWFGEALIWGVQSKQESDDVRQQQYWQTVLFRSRLAQPFSDGNALYRLRAIEQAGRGDRTALNAVLDEWAKLETESLEPRIAQLIVRSTVAGDSNASNPAFDDREFLAMAIEASAGWDAIMNDVRDPGKPVPHEQIRSLLGWLYSQQHGVAWGELRKAYTERMDAEFREVGYAYDIFRVLESTAANGQTTPVGPLLDAWETTIELHLDRLGVDDDAGRADLMLLDMYIDVVLQRDRGRLESADALFQAAIPRIEKYGEQVDWHARAMREHFEHCRLRVLARLDHDEAFRFAMDRVARQQQEILDETPGYVARSANAFADAFLLADQEEAIEVWKSLKSSELLDLERLPILIQSDAEDEREADSNQFAVAQMLRAYLVKYLQQGVQPQMRDWFLKIHGFRNQFLQIDSRGDEVLPAISETEAGNYFWQTILFFECLTDMELTDSPSHLFDSLALEREYWLMDDQPIQAPAWPDQPVVLILASSTRGNESWDQINWLDRFEQVAAWSQQEGENGFFCAVAIDDDRHSAVDRADEWNPPSSLMNAYGNSNASAFAAPTTKLPVVYAYQGKLLDHLIPDPRDISELPYFTALIFDRQRRLLTIKFSDMDHLETLEEAIAKALNIPPFAD